jgi:hypothetical protein
MSDLQSIYDRESFDIVVMCNVFHEIDCSQWLKLFKNDGHITNLLSPEGFLLIVEVMQLPVGEKAHQKGFLVLDTPQLRTFFQITKADKNFIRESEQNGRLKAHVIPKDCLKRVCSESRKNAIQEVRSQSIGTIRKLRSSDGTYQNGRSHGFWVQQLANAELALEEL